MSLHTPISISRFLFAGILILLVNSCDKPAETPTKNLFDLTGLVDPNIGSVHGRWFFYTPAAIPFGMAKLAPHTNAANAPGAWLPAGYDDRHTSIEGFGHFHEFQIGGVVVMPTVGDLQTIPGSLENPDSGYRSRFDKSDEIAETGYYSVLLKDYDIRAELSSTARVGYHRYTFPASDNARLIFDIGNKQGESSTIIEASMYMIGEREVEGYVITFPEYLKFCDPEKRVKMYFYGRMSKAPESYGAFVDEVSSPNMKETKGINNGMYFNFSTRQNEVIEMQVGLSYTSTQNAKLNLDTETINKSFDQVKVDARDAWNEKLGRIRVEGGKPGDQVKFYTGLYHALLGRGLASDVNGQYIQNDGEIGQVSLDETGTPRYAHYNTDGIWGGFWNLGQLWALAYPDYLSEYMRSNLDFYKESGWLHDGVAAGAHANGVQTNFNGLLLAATYNCGIRDIDINTAYEAARKNELEYKNRPFGPGKYDLGYFVKNGFIHTYDTTLANGWVFDFGVSHSLEYSFSSWAVAQFAKSLGKEDDYRKLMKQAQSWERFFDPETKYLRPLEPDGTFVVDFDPMEAWKGYQEGNAVQYTWYVPHDINGLIDKLGIDLFNERLENMFTDARKTTFGGGEDVDSFSGVEKLYNHGNQPCLHNPWLFNYSGKPWLTQKWTRLICDEFYGTEPLHGYGFGQDEDQGQLGAWYVMASMGLFDVQGHGAMRPTFQLGSPLFNRITIQLDNTYYEGEQVTIETVNNTAENHYIQSAELNGNSLTKCWFYRDALMKGGTLKLIMDSKPNTSWGSDPEKNPPSMSVD